jgi:hypothetical protein
LNGRQRSVVRSDEKGNYKIPNIDPDFYTLRMRTRSGISEPIGAMLYPGSYLRIDLRERKPMKDKSKQKRKKGAKKRAEAAKKQGADSKMKPVRGIKTASIPLKKSETTAKTKSMAKPSSKTPEKPGAKVTMKRGPKPKTGKSSK